MKKIFVFLLFFALLASFAYALDFGSTRSLFRNIVVNFSTLDEKLLNNKSVALKEARITVQAAIVSNGGVLESAPCLAEELVPGWSLDVVHIPRIEEDEFPENSCISFLNGDTERLIEYDTLGDFIGIIERK
jgi:hypothetical protein